MLGLHQNTACFFFVVVVICCWGVSGGREREIEREYRRTSRDNKKQNRTRFPVRKNRESALQEYGWREGVEVIASRGEGREGWMEYNKLSTSL